MTTLLCLVGAQKNEHIRPHYSATYSSVEKFGLSFYSVELLRVTDNLECTGRP